MDFTYTGTNLTYVRQTQPLYPLFQLSREQLYPRTTPASRPKQETIS